MSRNFHSPLQSSNDEQSNEQTMEHIQHNGHHSAHVSNPANRFPQFGVPHTPWIGIQPDEQLEHNGHYSAQGVYSSNGASQFIVPATPFSNGPTTPMPVIPITPPIGVPVTPFPGAPAIPFPDIQPAIVDPRRRDRVDQYAQWLQRNNNVTVPSRNIHAYQDAALEIQKVGGQDVRTFAPFQESTSALQVITSQQLLMLAILAIAWIVGLFFLHLLLFTITFGIITLLYICGFVASSILATNSFNSNSGEKIDNKSIVELDQLGVEWPTYTILCPLYKESAIVPQFVAAIKALDYPVDKLQVLFLTEEVDHDTRTALYSMQLPPSFTVLTVPKGSPQTKPRACNFGLLQAKGQFIVIFDAEDKPEADQLKKAVLTFANHGSEVACVQAKLNYYNGKQNLLTRWFTAEYSTWFDIMLPGLQRTGFSLPLGGTSNHFRTEVLRALGGWDAFNVTEDCDLGLRISQYNLKTAVLDSTTYEEATSRYKVWLFQRSRWIKGYLQTYLVHMRHPLQALQKGQYRKFLSLQLIVGIWTLVLLINPFMWALTLNYMLFRPVQLYSILFPGPILYMGAFCLIFGNFFYIYIHLIGCLRRKEYALIKWVLLIPLYWVMMSISAYIAFYQLIVKPHYWEKTQHGNHLAVAAQAQVRTVLSPVKQEGHDVLVSMPTTRVFAVTAGKIFKQVATVNTLERTTQRVTALRSNLSSQLGYRKVSRQIRLPRIRDQWLTAAIGIAMVASIASTLYVFQHHLTLVNADAVSHMEIARRIFDNVTPGLAQLGGVWLPLPHLLIALFAWNDYLWATGLAGSIVGMGCYLGTVVYTFLSARRLTHNSCASFIGTLVFMLNPNVLYLQATPLTEPVCWVTMTASCYYLLAWTQTDRKKYLVLTAAWTFLATLARYDGWFIFAILLVVIPLIGLCKHHSFRKIEGNLAVFVMLGGLGILLWFAWQKIIFGDLLYFQHGPYSAQSQAVNTALNSPYHNLLITFRIYALDCMETLGPGLSLLGLIAVFLFLLKRWRVFDTLAILTFLAPFAFYIVAIFEGQVPVGSFAFIHPLGIIPASEGASLFNARFGSEVVAPFSVFIATLVPNWSSISATLMPRLGRFIVRAILIMIILLQSGWTAYDGVVSAIASIDPPFCVASYPINVYLAQHYDGGNILQTDYPFHISEAEAAIHFSKVIYEGSSSLWIKALQHPEVSVDWIILQPGDIVAKEMDRTGFAFIQNFTLVATGPDGLRLYHKNGLPPLPTHPVTSYLLSEQQFCTPNSNQKK